MDRGRLDLDVLGGFAALDQAEDVLGHDLRLPCAGARRLVRAAVRDIADGEQVRVLRVLELQGRPHADEAVGRVDQGVARRGRERREELRVGRLARGGDDDVGLDRAAVLQRYGDGLSRCHFFSELICGHAGAGSEHEPVGWRVRWLYLDL